jgi:glycosyltransferase involved in cell wall biosynthesis
MLWIGAAHDPSGHADELRGFLRAQEQAGDEPALRGVGWTQRKAELSPRDLAMLERQESRTPTGPTVAVHQYLPTVRQMTITTAANVARAMFETDRLPESWLGPLLTRDEVWVPCAQNVEAFVAGGVPEDRVRIVGATIDFDLFTPGADPLDLRVDRDAFTFLTNFDFSARKGWEALLRAWGRAFDADSGVQLVLKTGSFYKDDNHVRDRIEGFLAAEFGARRDRLAPIAIRTDLLAAEDMPRLYAAADCYVLASRGEGWGRPYMEAMAMGLPTIASAWGGNTEFMSQRTSWLVEGGLVDVPDDAELFNGLYAGHRWFDPDVDALAEAMRAVAGDPAAARAKAALARPDLLERFGPDAMAATLREAAAAAADRFLSPSTARVVLRGAAGGDASLAVVNDGLAGALAADGVTVRRQAAAALPIVDDGAGVSHFWPPDFVPAADGPNVVVLPWEFGPPPQAWVDQVRAAVDRVWVPSAYVRDRHVAAGMPPGLVDVVPNGVDLERFTPDGPAAPLSQGAGCTFLFVGGTTWRKGADLLLAAWRRAFGPQDDVRLVVKDFGTRSWYKGQTAGDEILALTLDPAVAPVTYLSHDIPADQLPALYRGADAVVLPYRGEGFCLPALEAMACGVPVVHTGTGPTAEFVPADGGWALPARQVAIPADRMPEGLAGEGHVQEPDLDALVATLRAVAADAADRARRGAAAAAAARQHGWDAAGRAARASLASLAAEGLPLARTLRASRVEGRGTQVVYAPDWRDEATWRPALDAWVTTVSPHDDVTLTLFLGEGDPDAIAQAISAALDASGVPEAQLPDLTLCTPERPLLSLVHGADAVLVDAGERRPEVLRRAAVLLAPEAAAIAAWRDALPAAVEPVAA